MNGPSPWDVFCIHASPDKAHARALHDALAQRYRVFLDEVAIALGASWPQDLDAALQGSRVFAVLVSPHLDRAFYAQNEIAAAVALHRRYPDHRRIVPVLLEGKGDVVLAMPYALRSIQGIDVPACGGMAGVAERVGQLLQSLPDVGPLPAQVTAESAAAAPARHVLHQYPRAPLVPSHKVPSSLKQAYATLVRTREARQVIDDANAFRQEADPGDASVTLIKQFRLRSPEDNPPLDFWMDAFAEAGKHGPRMLAALVLVVEDGEFPESVKKDRRTLLEYLRNPAP
jgi:hypothetical protein